MRTVKERMNLYITKSLMDDLRRAVPARDRTRFVEEVLARELRRRKLQEALTESFGAWKDSDHPELDTPADIERWLETGRAGLIRDWNPDV